MIAERIIAILVAVALLLPGRAAAQQQAGLKAGDRVRLTAPDAGLDEFEGTLAAIDTEARILRVQTEDTTVSVPIASVTNLKVSRGERSRAGGLLGGALVGGLLGAAIGSFAGEEDCSREGLDRLAPCADKGDTALIGGVLGAAVGAGIGYRLTGGPRWEPVLLQELYLSIRPLRAGGPMVLASIRF